VGCSLCSGLLGLGAGDALALTTTESAHARRLFDADRATLVTETVLS